MAGNWFLDEGERWQPPLALSEFLAAGPKPVYVGFGSMLGGDAQRLSDIWRQALRNTGQRGIFATGWGGLTAVDDAQIFCLSAAPHDWLFPRVAAAVHHGGAGTTAAAAKAGVPSVVMPFFGDQPFWAWRLASLGAAPAAVTRKTLSVDSATEALRYALTAPCQDKAAELGQRIRAEDGVDEAIAQLQRWQLLPGMPDFQLAGSAA